MRGGVLFIGDRLTEDEQRSGRGRKKERRGRMFSQDIAVGLRWTLVCFLFFLFCCALSLSSWSCLSPCALLTRELLLFLSKPCLSSLFYLYLSSSSAVLVLVVSVIAWQCLSASHFSTNVNPTCFSAACNRVAFPPSEKFPLSMSNADKKGKNSSSRSICSSAK